MTPEKTPRQREKELLTLMATESGRAVPEELASRYAGTATRVNPRGKSVISFILVHERVRGPTRDGRTAGGPGAARQPRPRSRLG